MISKYSQNVQVKELFIHPQSSLSAPQQFNWLLSNLENYIQIDTPIEIYEPLIGSQFANQTRRFIPTAASTQTGSLNLLNAWVFDTNKRCVFMYPAAPNLVDLLPSLDNRCTLLVNIPKG